MVIAQAFGFHAQHGPDDLTNGLADDVVAFLVGGGLDALTPVAIAAACFLQFDAGGEDAFDQRIFLHSAE